MNKFKTILSNFTEEKLSIDSYELKQNIIQNSFDDEVKKLRLEFKGVKSAYQAERLKFEKYFRKELSHLIHSNEYLVRCIKNFTDQEIALNEEKVRPSKVKQHYLIDAVYDRYDMNIALVPDSVTDIAVHTKILVDSVHVYDQTFEREHISAGTALGLRNAIRKSNDRAVRFIIDKYGQQNIDMFTNITNGTRRGALHMATKVYRTEFKAQFDIELYKILEDVRDTRLGI